MAKKLFIGNISWKLKAEGLKRLFSKHGKIEECVIIMSDHSGRSKGMGFVTFKDDEDADKALEAMNGYEVDGRKINVDVARPPAEK